MPTKITKKKIMLTKKQLKKKERNEMFYKRYLLLREKGVTHYKACEEIAQKHSVDLCTQTILVIINKLLQEDKK
jgi:hypothetical protein